MIILNQILIVLGFILCIVRWFYINYKLSIKQPKVIIHKEKPIPISDTNTQQPIPVINNVLSQPTTLSTVMINSGNYEYDIEIFSYNQGISYEIYIQNVKDGLNGKDRDGWELIYSENEKFYFRRRIKELI
jgi:hypothetical protein